MINIRGSQHIKKATFGDVKKTMNVKEFKKEYKNFLIKAIKSESTGKLTMHYGKFGKPRGSKHVDIDRSSYSSNLETDPEINRIVDEHAKKFKAGSYLVATYRNEQGKSSEFTGTLKSGEAEKEVGDINPMAGKGDAEGKISSEISALKHSGMGPRDGFKLNVIVKTYSTIGLNISKEFTLEGGRADLRDKNKISQFIQNINDYIKDNPGAKITVCKGEMVKEWTSMSH